jgi:hypothetical protein
MITAEKDGTDEAAGMAAFGNKLEAGRKGAPAAAAAAAQP